MREFPTTLRSHTHPQSHRLHDNSRKQNTRAAACDPLWAARCSAVALFRAGPAAALTSARKSIRVRSICSLHPAFTAWTIAGVAQALMLAPWLTIVCGAAAHIFEVAKWRELL